MRTPKYKIKRLVLETKEVSVFGWPWSDPELASRFALYCTKLGRGSFRYWVELEKPLEPAQPRQRPVLPDNDTYLFMDI